MPEKIHFDAVVGELLEQWRAGYDQSVESQRRVLLAALKILQRFPQTPETNKRRPSMKGIRAFAKPPPAIESFGPFSLKRSNSPGTSRLKLTFGDGRQKLTSSTAVFEAWSLNQSLSVTATKRRIEILLNAQYNHITIPISAIDDTHSRMMRAI